MVRQLRGRAMSDDIREDVRAICVPDFQGKRTTFVAALSSKLAWGLHACAAIAGLLAATCAIAQETEPNGRRASPAAKPSWEFALTAYPTVVRDGENYTSGIAVADRGPLHLEARVQLRIDRRAFGLRRLDIFRRRRKSPGR